MLRKAKEYIVTRPGGGRAVLWSIVAVLTVVAVWSIVRRYGNTYTSWTGADTSTYIGAWHNICEHGIDVFRTPVYPLLIGGAEALTGAFYGSAVAIIESLQWLIFILSVFSFYGIARRLICGSVESLAATAMYAFSPFALYYNNYIMTESLAASWLVMLTHLLLLYYERPSLKCISGITLLTLLMVFLRPSLIFLLPLVAVYAIVVMVIKRDRWRRYVALLPGIAAVGIAAAGYIGAMDRQFGVPAMSSVLMLNDLEEFCLHNTVSDADLEHYPVIKRSKTYCSPTGDSYYFSDYELNKQMREAYIEYRRLMAVYADEMRAYRLEHAERFMTFANEVSMNPESMLSRTMLKLPGCGAWVALWGVFCLVVLLPSLLRRRFNGAAWLVASIFCSTVIVVIYGAYGDYFRLMYPVSWIVWLMFVAVVVKAVEWLRPYFPAQR